MSKGGDIQPKIMNGSDRPGISETLGKGGMN